LHDIFEGGPYGASYIEGFIRFMTKGAQCRKAACQNAGVRIDQGAVEVQKNGASHERKIAAKSNPVQVLVAVALPFHAGGFSLGQTTLPAIKRKAIVSRRKKTCYGTFTAGMGAVGEGR
jgi:hypothetical protein